MQYDLVIKRTLREAHGILWANLPPASNLPDAAAVRKGYSKKDWRRHSSPISIAFSVTLGESKVRAIAGGNQDQDAHPHGAHQPSQRRWAIESSSRPKIRLGKRSANQYFLNRATALQGGLGRSVRKCRLR
jgi:hypothetical protein